MTTNVFVDAVLTASGCKSYAGVYSSNNIPENRLAQSPAFSVVANLSSDQSVGTHFVAIVGLPNLYYYFDPLGLSPPEAGGIGNFLRRLGRRRRGIYNSQAVQHPDSEFCALFCMLAILCMEPGSRKPLPRFAKENLRKNDAIVVRHLRRLLPKYVRASIGRGGDGGSGGASNQ